jgi:hypothetical protein
MEPLLDLSNATADPPVPTPPVGQRVPFTSRFWKLYDALTPTPVRARRRSIWGSGLLSLEPRTKRDDRSAAALSILEPEAPATSAAGSQFVVSARGLPFRCDEASLLAFGTGDTVFQLGTPEAGWVCKVQRVSLGVPTRDLERIARRRRETFAQGLRQYAPVQDVFPEVRFLVVQTPLFGVPAVAALQAFVPGPRRDLFRDVSEAELRQLVEAVPELRAQVAGLLRCTIAAWERGGWMVNLGADDLVLAGQGEGARLAYLDVEMKQAGALRGTIREGMYQVLVDRMGELLESIDRD